MLLEGVCVWVGVCAVKAVTVGVLGVARVGCGVTPENWFDVVCSLQ